MSGGPVSGGSLRALVGSPRGETTVFSSLNNKDEVRFVLI